VPNTILFGKLVFAKGLWTIFGKTEKIEIKIDKKTNNKST
jgi:hypothetical protein